MPLPGWCRPWKPKEEVSSPRPITPRPKTPEQPPARSITLVLSNIDGQDLTDTSRGDVIGRYIIFRVGNVERRTREVDRGLRNPRWGDVVEIPVEDVDRDVLEAYIMDVVDDRGRAAESRVGSLEFSLNQYKPLNKEYRRSSHYVEGMDRNSILCFDARLVDSGSAADRKRSNASDDEYGRPYVPRRQNSISVVYDDDDERAYPYDENDPRQRSLHGERSRSRLSFDLRGRDREALLHAEADNVRRTGSNPNILGPPRVSLKPGDRVRLSIIRGVSLLAKDRGGTSDPYVLVKYAGKEIGKTAVKKETLDPEFNEAYEIDVLDGHDTINLTVFDWNRIQSHSYLGEANVSIADHLFAGMQGTEVSFPLSSTKIKEVSPGDLDAAGSKLILKFDTELPKVADLQKAMSMRQSIKPIPSTGSLGMSMAPQAGDKIAIEVLMADGLISADSNGLSDPYVVVKYNGKKVGETPVKKEQLRPEWNWRCPEVIEVKGGADLINFTVFDWNRFQSHKYLGEVDVPIRDMKAGGEYEHTFALKTTQESKLSASELSNAGSRIKLRFVCDTAAAVTQRAPQVVITDESPSLQPAPSFMIDAKTGLPVVSALQGAPSSGPPPGSRYAHRGDKVYLTVVQGDRLIARDSNGKSDPFVIVRYNGKDLAKTEVKKETLNPIWNHRVVIESIGDDNDRVLLTIFDWDRFGGNDYMGEVEVPLSKAYVGAANTLKLPVTTSKPSDVKPDELTSAGSTLTVKLEAEGRGDGPSGGGSLSGASPGLRRGSSALNLDWCGRPTAPQEGMGLPESGDKVRIWVHEGRSMVSKDSNGKSDPYVVATYMGKELGKSETIKETLDPVWNPPFRVPDFVVQGAGSDPENRVTLQVFDWNRIQKHKYMGEVSVPMLNLRAGVKFKAPWPMVSTSPADITDEEIAKCNSKLVLEIEVERALATGGMTSRRPSSTSLLQGAASSRSLTGEVIDLDKLSKDKKQPPLLKGDRVQILVAEGRDLPAKDSNGKSDPFVTIKAAGKQVAKSEVIKETLNPAWNFKFDLEVGDPQDVVVIEVWDWDRFGSNDYMGEVEIPLGKLRANQKLEGLFALKTTRKECKPEEIVRSRLKLRIETPNKLDRAMSQFFTEEAAIGLQSAAPGGERSPAASGDRVSIAVVEGKDLIAKDSNGKSDPFVVVKIVGKKTEQLGKSEKIVETLNPQWNYSVPTEFHIVDANDLLLVEVWDWDRWGTNDYMGEVRLPLHTFFADETFEAFVPMQSSKSSVKQEELARSMVKLRVKVTRPAGRGLRDKAKRGEENPRAQAGDRGRVDVVEARRLPGVDGGTADPYAVVRWESIAKPLGQTEPRRSTLNPNWGAAFELIVPSDNDALIIEVFDWNRRGSHTSLGMARVPVSDLRAGLTYDPLGLPLVSSRDGQPVGDASLYFSVSIDPRPGQAGGKGGALRVGDKVRLTVVEGRKLIARDSNGKSDPFVIVRLGPKQISKSDKIKETLDPGWNHACEFEVPSVDEKLIVEVWDWDRFGSNDYMGEVQVELRELHTGVIDEWYDMVTTKPKDVRQEELSSCQVHLRFEVEQTRGDMSRREAGGVRRHGRLRVECIEARSLIAADINGKSDPYCVLNFGESAGKAGQRKTKVIQKNLNPIWRESFEFDVSDPSEFLKIVLYDEDLIGSHDYLGEVTVGLDLLDGAGNNPLDNWFPLASSSTKKKVTGELHLRLEHFPPADAPRGARTIREMYGLESKGGEMMDARSLRFDPGHVGQLDVIVLKGRNLAVKDFFSSDPYCVLQIENHKSKTQTIKSNLNPVWNAAFSFRLTKPDSLLKIDVFDEDDTSKDDFMGTANVSVAELRDGEVKDQWLPLTSGTTKEKVSGDICLRLRYVVAPEFKAEQTKRLETFKSIVLNKRGQVVVKAIEARQLPKMDIIGTIDPYLKIRLGDREVKTKHIQNNQNPYWGEEFRFEITEAAINTPDFVVEMWDRDRGSADDFGGQFKVSLVSLLDGKLHDDWYPLMDKTGAKSVQGQVHIAFQFYAHDALPKEPPPPVEEIDTKGRKERTWGTAATGVWFGQTELGRLRVGVVEARYLYGRAVALGPGYREVFVELAMGEEEHHTSYQCITQPTAPVAWNENFTFHVTREDACLAVSVLDCPERAAVRPARLGGTGTTLRGGAGGASGDRDTRHETFLGGFKVNVADLKDGLLVDKWFVLSLSGTGEKAITAFDNTLTDVDPFKAADLALMQGGTRTSRAIGVGNLGGAVGVGALGTNATGPAGVNAARGPPQGAAIIHIKMRYESTEAAQRRREASRKKELTLRRAEHTGPWRGTGAFSESLMMERAMLDDRRAYQRTLGTARRAKVAGRTLFFDGLEEDEEDEELLDEEGEAAYLVHTRASLARQRGRNPYGLELAHSTRRRAYGHSASPEKRATLRTVPGASDVDLYIRGGGTYMGERARSARMKRAALAGPRVDSHLDPAFVPPKRETLADQRAAAGLLAELHTLKKRLHALEKGGAAAATILRQRGAAGASPRAALTGMYDEILFLKKRLNAEEEELRILRHDAILQEERAHAHELRAAQLERQRAGVDARGLDARLAEGPIDWTVSAAAARALLELPDEDSREELEERARLASKADALRKLACDREAQLEEMYAQLARRDADVSRAIVSAAPRDGTSADTLEREIRGVQRLMDIYKSLRKENHAIMLRINDKREDFERMVADLRLRKSRLYDMTSKEHKRVLDGMHQELKLLRQQVRENASELELQKWRHKQQEDDGEFRERAMREKLDRRAEREERLLRERDQFLGQLRVYRPEWVNPASGLVQVPMARIGDARTAQPLTADRPLPDYSLQVAAPDPRDRLERSPSRLDRSASYRPYPGSAADRPASASPPPPLDRSYSFVDRDGRPFPYPPVDRDGRPFTPLDRDGRPYPPSSSPAPYPPSSSRNASFRGS